MVDGYWEWHKSGDENKDGKYVGEIENGVPNGHGILTYSGGDKYVGEFKDGEKHGRGTLIVPNVTKYFGGWKDGRTHGQGIQIFPNGIKYVGEFKDGRDWNVTEYNKNGNISGQHVNGRGSYGGEDFVEDNHKGETLFRWGNPSGSGFIWKGFGEEGAHPKYEGEVENGIPNGLGSIIYSERSKFIGNFKDGLPNGQGTYIDLRLRTKFYGENKYGLFWNGFLLDKEDAIIAEFKNGKSVIIKDYIEDDSNYVLRTKNKIINVSKSKWEYVGSSYSYAKSYESKTKYEGHKYKQMITVFLIPMTDDRKSEEIAKNEYFDSFVHRANSITVQIRIDKGDYWVLSRETYKTIENFPVQTVYSYSNALINFRGIQNRIDRTRFILNKEF